MLPIPVKLICYRQVAPDPLHGLYEVSLDGRTQVLEYEPDTALRDNEQIPLLEDGGIEAFFRREVLPYAPDAWIDADKTRIGYEISFTRYFYKPVPMRTLEEITADIRALLRESAGLLDRIIGDSQ
jgi:type I restriction enzyme M protein